MGSDPQTLLWAPILRDLAQGYDLEGVFVMARLSPSEERALWARELRKDLEKGARLQGRRQSRRARAGRRA